MKNKKTIYNSDEFRKTVRCLTEKIREADELEFVDVEKSFQDVMKRVGREKKVPHRRHIYRWSLSIEMCIRDRYTALSLALGVVPLSL